MELKPCPFCGGSASLKYCFKYYTRYVVNIICDNCKAKSNSFEHHYLHAEKDLINPSARLAVEAWNTRKDPEHILTVDQLPPYGHGKGKNES